MKKTKTTHFLHFFNENKSSFLRNNLARSEENNFFYPTKETKETRPIDPDILKWTQETNNRINRQLFPTKKKERIKFNPEEDIPHIQVRIEDMEEKSKKLLTPQEKWNYTNDIIALTEKLENIFSQLDWQQKSDKSLGQRYAEFRERHYGITNNIRTLRHLCLDIWLEAKAKQLEEFHRILWKAK